MLTISLRPSTGRGWNVCHQGNVLFSELPLGEAIQLARQLARAEHERTRQPTCVDVPGPLGRIVAACFARQADLYAGHPRVA